MALIAADPLGAQGVKPIGGAAAGDQAAAKISVPARQADAIGGAAEAPAASTGEAPQKDDAKEATPAKSATPNATRDAAETVEKPATKPRLVVSSWAGAYGKAQQQAIIDPLARDLGLAIERRTHAGGNAALDAADVAELDQSSLLAACAAGRLVKLRSLLTSSEYDEAASAGPDGGDFIANSVSDCGMPTFAWSSILIANGEAMKKLARRRYKVPTRLSDLLRPKRYPGKRALIRKPKRLLEMMLLGSGVRRDEVYQVLATRDGQDQAFKILDRLSKHILWVDGPREALIALDQGKVTIAMTYSGRAFRRLIASRLLPIWDGHIIDFASWAVPISSENRDKAKQFILAATSAESLAAQARIWPYGPMRRSALRLALRHDLLDTRLDQFMPTSDMRLGQGLVFNAGFWTEHGAALEDRFAAWLAGVPFGIRVPVPVKAPPAASAADEEAGAEAPSQQ
jgi:putative spermidine/putrescine transport system substrate-binding protein